MILHFFRLLVSTFSAAALFRRQHVRQQLYFIPVLIYTPNKVKSKQREKKWLRQTEPPICQSLPMIQPVFSFGCKIFVTASYF